MEVADELKDQLPGGRIEARLGGDAVELVYLQNESVVREMPSELNARITLRLPEDLKSRIEKAATKERISLNSWLLKASERGSFEAKILGSNDGKCHVEISAKFESASRLSDLVDITAHTFSACQYSLKSVSGNSALHFLQAMGRIG